MSEIRYGNCQDILKEWVAEGRKAQICVTSPPYFGLRDYGVDGQFGREKTPDEYVAHLVEVFRDVRELLTDDGTLWLNIGDSYANDSKWGGSSGGKHAKDLHGNTGIGRGKTFTGLKSKDLIGIPWRVAFALQADGWYLRQDIIWAKPNPMPESVRDRCTKSHEYIFLLSKSPIYYFDIEANLEAAAASTIARLSQPTLESQVGSSRVPGKTNGNMKAVGRGGKNAFRGQGHFRYGEDGPANREGHDMKNIGTGLMRNRRSVWTVTTKPYKGAHFATFPSDLIEPCILAGSRPGDVVLDPFIGSGTTAQVALKHGRQYLGCELNPEYKALIDKRIELAA